MTEEEWWVFSAAAGDLDEKRMWSETFGFLQHC